MTSCQLFQAPHLTTRIISGAAPREINSSNTCDGRVTILHTKKKCIGHAQLSTVWSQASVQQATQHASLLLRACSSVPPVASMQSATKMRSSLAKLGGSLFR